MTFIREQVLKRFQRSPGWSRIRKEFLEENPECVVCSTKKGLEVHHINPFYKSPELEFTYGNLMTLCRKHHSSAGHIGYWKMYNPCIEKTVQLYKRILTST